MPSVLILLDFVPNQQRTFEAFLLRVVQSLSRQGWRAVLAVAGNPSPRFSAELTDYCADCHIVRFPLTASGVDALASSLMERLPEVMTTSFVSCFDPRLHRLKKRLRNPRWIVNDHSSGVASAKRGVKRLLARIRGWYVGRRVNRILAISDFVARRNIEQSYLPSSKVRVLYNGVDLSRFQFSSQFESKKNCPPSLVFVGQLIPEKGVLTLLKALKILSVEHALSPVVEIAGRGKQEDELRRYASACSLSNVHFVGQSADVSQLYQRASIVVAPSEWAEAFGLVIAEAMACGACVLAADSGGIAEVVGREQEAGVLFRSGDARDLAEKIRLLLNESHEQRRVRGFKARQRVERLFNLDAMVQGFVAEVVNDSL